MKEFSDYLAKLPKTPLVEAVQSLYESYFGPWNFKSVQELRDFVDQKTYERFKLYNKQEVASGKTPFGSLDAINAIDMDTFLKSVGDKGYDIENDMKNQLVDANYINNLSYDWFICLFNMKVLGWSKPVTEAVDALNESAYPLMEGDTHVYIDSPSAMNQKLYDWIRYCANFFGDSIPYNTFDALVAAAKEYRSELNIYKRVINDGVEIIKDGVEHGLLPKELLDGGTFNDVVYGATKTYNAPSLEGLVLNVLENNQSLSDLVNKCRSFPQNANMDLFKKVFAFGRDDCIDMDSLFALIGPSLLVYNSNDSMNDRRVKILGRIWHDGLLYDADALYGDLMLKYPKPEYDEVPIPKRNTSFST